MSAKVVTLAKTRKVMVRKTVVVAVDPGDKVSGVVVLEDGHIKLASNSSNEEVMEIIRPYQGTRYKLRVVIEDIRPYSRKQLSPNVIGTCKFIGELRYRLKAARIAFREHPRSDVKQWIFNTYKPLIIPLVDAKIAKKIIDGTYGNLRKATFVYVDDGMIVAAMKKELDIAPSDRIGERNKYGLSEHSWQALALGLFFYRTQLKDKVLV